MATLKKMQQQYAKLLAEHASLKRERNNLFNDIVRRIKNGDEALRERVVLMTIDAENRLSKLQQS